MKKIFFLIPFLSILISSCSSDNDPISQNTDLDPVKYTISLNVKSAGFEVDKTPLRSTENGSQLLQVIAYKNTGEVYSDTVYQNKSITELISNDGNAFISIKLPEGSYHLAILSAMNTLTMPLKNNTIKPNNYETDYYSSELRPELSVYENAYDNENIYFETSDLVVSSEGNKTGVIELKPMWSEIELTVKDYNSVKRPSEARYMRFFYAPQYYGFGVKSKLATKIDPASLHRRGSMGAYSFDLNSESAMKSEPKTFKYITSKGTDNSMSFKMQFLRGDNALQDFITLSNVDIKLPNKLENGYRYKVTGNLPSDPSLGNGGLSISIKPMSKDSINVPFE